MVTQPKPKAEPMMITVERSFGTAFGFNAILIKLERFLNYQFQRFIVQNKIKGRWRLLVYVSQEGAGDPPEVSGEK